MVAQRRHPPLGNWLGNRCVGISDTFFCECLLGLGASNLKFALSSDHFHLHACSQIPCPTRFL